MEEHRVSGVRRGLRHADLKLLPERERQKQVREFANYATRALMFRLALLDTSASRGQLLRAAEEAAKAEVVGGPSDDELDAEINSPFTVTAARPITAQNLGDPDIAELAVLNGPSPKYTTQDFLSMFSDAREAWTVNPQYEYWEKFFDSKSFPPAVSRLVVFEQGRPIMGPSHAARGAGLMMQYAQVLSMERWLSLNSHLEVKIFLHSQASSPQDKEALGLYGIKVVSGQYGVHEASAMIDKNTVVVDFNSMYPVRRIALEACQPAAIICRPIPAVPDPVVKTFSVLDENVNGGKELVVPGHFLRDPCLARAWNALKTDYGEFRPRGLDFGSGCGLEGGLVIYLRTMRY